MSLMSITTSWVGYDPVDGEAVAVSSHRNDFMPCPVGRPRGEFRDLQRMRALINSRMVATAPIFIPPGMMMSAYRLDGSTNSRCIGRTVARY